jgi:hypothetical protein
MQNVPNSGFVLTRISADIIPPEIEFVSGRYPCCLAPLLAGKVIGKDTSTCVNVFLFAYG